MIRSATKSMAAGALAVILGLVLVRVLPVEGQTSAADVKQKTEEAAAALKDYAVDRKDEAVAAGRKLVDDLHARVKALDARLAGAKGDVKEKWQRQREDLERKRATASQKLAELQKESGRGWESVKRGFIDAYGDLKQSFDKAAADFR